MSDDKLEYVNAIIEDLNDEMAEDRHPVNRYVTCSFQGMRAVLDLVAELRAENERLRDLLRRWLRAEPAMPKCPHVLVDSTMIAIAAAKASKDGTL